MATETVTVNTRTQVTPIVRSGENIAAVVGELDPAASVSSSVQQKYRRVPNAEADHGEASDIAGGVEAAIQSGAPFVWTVAFDPLAQTETFTSSSAESGNLDTANLPLVRVTGVTDNTNAKDASPILYTSLSGTEFPSASGDEFIVNPDTGEYAYGDSSTSDLTVEYEEARLTAPLDNLNLEAHEVVCFANQPLSNRTYGIYKRLLTYADNEDKLVTAGLESGVAPSSTTKVGGSQTLVEAFHQHFGERLFPVAAFYTGDLSAAVAGERSTKKPNDTAKEQPAPTGVDINDEYLRRQYGAEENPASDTFHGYGANAIYENETGQFVYTNDRAAQPLTDFYRFWSRTRSVRSVRQRLKNELLALRRSSGRAIPFTGGGIAAVQNTLSGAIDSEIDEGTIVEGVIDVPQIGEVSDQDKQNRVLDLVQVSVRLTEQVHLVDTDLTVET